MTKAGLVLHRDDVSEAIRQINAIWQQGGLSTVVAIGDYVIRVFYGGDLDLALSFSPTKPKGLRELFERADELHVSVHALKESVRISVQYHALPRAIADGLTKTHHSALLPVEDVAAKLVYARRALEAHLSAERLEQVVRKEWKRHPGGRPRGPALLKVTARLVRACDAAEVARILKPAVLRRLTGEQIAAAKADLRLAREFVERIADALDR